MSLFNLKYKIVRCFVDGEFTYYEVYAKRFLIWRGLNRNGRTTTCPYPATSRVKALEIIRKNHALGKLLSPNRKSIIDQMGDYYEILKKDRVKVC